MLGSNWSLAVGEEEARMLIDFSNLQLERQQFELVALIDDRNHHWTIAELLPLALFEDSIRKLPIRHSMSSADTPS